MKEVNRAKLQAIPQMNLKQSLPYPKLKQKTKQKKPNGVFAKSC